MINGNARIAVDGEPDELRSIANWFQHEEEFRGRVRPVDAEQQPGDMGGTLEALMIAISSGTGTAFVTSLFTYLGQRRKEVVLDLDLKREYGRELRLKLTDKHTLDAAMKQADAFFSASGSP
ncbi:hypothetical protein [Amycolatopsis sp. NPDC001319]|uniref:effector-associated constant component EACC1 n=1 Tax=unclassified Amycolatopsis TaxID=2618356 RepID=UPI0036D0315F